MKKTKKILPFLLTLVLVFSFTSQAFAATSLPSISSSGLISGGTVNASEKVNAYTAIGNLEVSPNMRAASSSYTVKPSVSTVDLYLKGTNSKKFTVSQNYPKTCYMGVQKSGTQTATIIDNGWNSNGTAKTYTLKGTSAGSFKLRFVLHDSASSAAVATSSVVQVNVYEGALPAPAIASATANSTSSIAVKWNGVSGAASYKLYRRKSGDSNYSCIKTGIKSTSYSDSGLSAGTKYWYRVYAVNSSGASSVRSESFDGWTKPATPVISSVNTVSDSKLTVKWNAVAGAKSYLVYRRKSGTPTGIANYTKIGTTSSTSYTDSGLEANTKYWYSVYAVTDRSDSADVVATSGSATSKDGTTLKKSQTVVTAKSISGATVSAVKDQIYTGKAIKPSANADFTVKVGSTTLKNGTDFSLSYKNNTNIGTATVVITGKGSYSGTKSVTFQIVPATPSISGIKSSGLQQMTVKSTASKGATKYQFKYAANSNLSNFTKTSRDDPSAVIKNLTTGKTYYVAVRAYKTIGDQYYWSAWSGTKKVTIAKVANTIKFSNSNIKSNKITLNKSVSAQSFSLGAKANGGAKLSYGSNNKSVTVNSAGKVTAAKNFSGTAKITVTAAATDDYNKAASTITVQVNAVSAKRQEVVDYMKSMATVKWKPSKTFTHWSGGRKWTAGTTYYGIPYTQCARTTNLSAFKKLLKNGVYIGPSGQRTYKGSDCSSAVSYAWQQANSKFKVTSTSGMLPKKSNSSIKAVGTYGYKEYSNTKTICTKNGRTVMYNAYKKLQPGDALVERQGSGHVMLVTSVSGDYVKVTHQTTYSSARHSTWRVDEKYSFASLYSGGYIPVTMSSW